MSPLLHTAFGCSICFAWVPCHACCLVLDVVCFSEFHGDVRNSWETAHGFARRFGVYRCSVPTIPRKPRMITTTRTNTRAWYLYAISNRSTSHSSSPCSQVGTTRVEEERMTSGNTVGFLGKFLGPSKVLAERSRTWSRIPWRTWVLTMDLGSLEWVRTHLSISNKYRRC